MTLRLIYRPAAEADLENIYDHIARDSRANAIRFTDRIDQHIQSLAMFPKRGTRHDQILPGLRIFGIERRVTILFRVVPEGVEILRVLYGGRDIRRALNEN